MSELATYRGTGKRKTSVARVILRPGDDRRHGVEDGIVSQNLIGGPALPIHQGPFHSIG